MSLAHLTSCPNEGSVLPHLCRTGLLTLLASQDVRCAYDEPKSRRVRCAYPENCQGRKGKRPPHCGRGRSARDASQPQPAEARGCAQAREWRAYPGGSQMGYGLSAWRRGDAGGLRFDGAWGIRRCGARAVPLGNHVFARVCGAGLEPSGRDGEQSARACGRFAEQHLKTSGSDVGKDSLTCGGEAGFCRFDLAFEKPVFA